MKERDIVDFDKMADDVLSRLGNTSSIIITDIRMLNEMSRPGLNPGKLYMFPIPVVRGGKMAYEEYLDIRRPDFI